MSDNVEEENSSSNIESSETESARKRRRLNIYSGWKMTVRQTDDEILQEMGVGLLIPDDGDTLSETDEQCKKVKYKEEIENGDPNVNSCVTSPRAKLSPKRSPKKKYSPVPGPSRIRSPRSTEKSARVLQPVELETTLLQPHSSHTDEETPLPLLPVSCDYLSSVQSPSYTASVSSRNSTISPVPTQLVLDEDLLTIRLRRCKQLEQSGPDAFSVLSDEMMLSVFQWLPKRVLVQCMLVCKRWHRVANDEMFWQRLELGNKLLAKDSIGKILAKKPVIVRLAGSDIGEWINPGACTEASRIQYLDLSMCTLGLSTLNTLLSRCPVLKKLSLEFVQVNEDTCRIIGECSRMETLNMTMCSGVTTDGLRDILNGCNALQSLNVSWCDLSRESAQTLCLHAPVCLQRLNMAGTRNMTDDMVGALVGRCHRLLELDLSDCSKLCGEAVLSVLALSRLEHLALSRCYLLPPHVLTKLNSMPALQYLEVWGMLQEASLAALRTALPAIQINQFIHSAIARPTVGTRRTSIWGLRTRD